VKCTWEPNTEEESPHRHVRPAKVEKVANNILEVIGNTPLVQLNHIVKDKVKCRVLAKCEYLNPGGSVKDRAAFRMLDDAEKAGILEKGKSKIGEASSGNLGVGIALAAAVKGYQAVITMPRKMGKAKESTLKALGAEVIRTPNEAAWDAWDSHIGVIVKMAQEDPDFVHLDQYINPSNPISHFDGTAAEIIDQTDGNVDMVVAGVGTGGTITGLGRKLKEFNPNIRVVGVDPVGSILAGPGEITPYEVEGTGYDFIPTTMDASVIDEWIKTRDYETFYWARRLIKEEGLLVGGSSGSAVQGLVEAGQDLTEDQTAVIILPDSIRNYLDKFADDTWMDDVGLHSDAEKAKATELWNAQDASSLYPEEPIPLFAESNVHSSVEALNSAFKASGARVVAVPGDDGKYKGALSESQIFDHITTSSGGKSSDPLFDVNGFEDFIVVQRDTPLRKVIRVVRDKGFCVMENPDGTHAGVVTHQTLMNHLS